MSPILLLDDFPKILLLEFVTKITLFNFNESRCFEIVLLYLFDDLTFCKMILFLGIPPQ